MVIEVILLAALMAFSAFFSAAETSLTAISAIKLTAMLSEGVAGAKFVERIVADKAKFLSAVLIGNNGANVAISTISAALVIGAVGNDNGLLLTITTLAVTFIIVIFCEITPKTIAVRLPELVACFVAPPMLVIVKILTPVSAVIDAIVAGVFFVLRIKRTEGTAGITEAEIRAMVDVSNREGVIQQEEREMLDNVLELDERRAKDIMTPRTRITAVPADSSFNAVMRVFRVERFSRLPVYEGDLDKIIGVLHLKDVAFLREGERRDFKAENYAHPPFFSYEGKPVNDLLSDVLKKNVSFTVILDEYGGTAGIVTSEDLVEEIVGDIYDEYDDDQPMIQKLSDDEFEVDGAAPIDDFNEIAASDIESEDYESIGGYVTGLFGKIPETGDEVSDGGFTFKVESVEKTRIEKMRIIKLI